MLIRLLIIVELPVEILLYVSICTGKKTMTFAVSAFQKWVSSLITSELTAHCIFGIQCHSRECMSKYVSSL